MIVHLLIMVRTQPLSVPPDWSLPLPDIIEHTPKHSHALEWHACSARTVDYILCLCYKCTFHYFYCMSFC